MFKRKGFTLIELVMVIVILGVLAAVAIPRYFSLQSEARLSAERGVVGGVRAGILTYHADQLRQGNDAYPTTLDSAAASSTSVSDNPFFDTVLAQGGITDGSWSKDSSGYYDGPYAGGVENPPGTPIVEEVYIYTSSDGSFIGTTK